MNLKFCPVCGTRLHPQPNPPEEPALYCDSCGEYRKMILIRQYGKGDLILVAGYVDKGETAEAAVLREVREEIGLKVESPRFLCSHYYEPSETLMLNYLVVTADETPHPNWEVDSWEWVPVREAIGKVKPGGLAETLLRDYSAYILDPETR